MTQVPNLANLSLGIPTAGYGKKGRPDKDNKANPVAQQEEKGSERYRDIFVQCRNVVLDKFSVNRLKERDHIRAFLIRVANNVYFNVCVAPWLQGHSSNATSWAVHVWELHYEILKFMSLDDPNSFLLEVGLPLWDPPTYPLTVQHATNDKIKQVARVVFDRLQGEDFGDVMNDGRHAKRLVLLTRQVFQEVLGQNSQNPFIEQTKDYWVDLSYRVAALGKELKEQDVTPPPPRPVARVEEHEKEEREVVHNPSDGERNPQDVNLPTTFVKRRMRQLRT